MNPIYVLPIGDIAGDALIFAQRAIQQRFNHICNVLAHIDIPGNALDRNRLQYSSAQILRKIIELCPPDAKRIIGITEVDLFVPVLTFVFGQAQLDGIAAIVSTCRLRPEFYGLTPSMRITLERLDKEITHELGHTFGLTHCHNSACVMYFSNSIREIDNKRAEFCGACARMLAGKLN